MDNQQFKYNPPRFDKVKKIWYVEMLDEKTKETTIFDFEDFTDAWKFYNTYKRGDFKQDIKNRLRNGKF